MSRRRKRQYDPAEDFRRVLTGEFLGLCLMDHLSLSELGDEQHQRCAQAGKRYVELYPHAIESTIETASGKRGCGCDFDDVFGSLDPPLLEWARKETGIELLDEPLCPYAGLPGDDSRGKS